MTISATTLLPVSPMFNNIPFAQKGWGLGKKEGRESGRLAKKSSWVFLLNALIFPVSSGPFFSKSYFMHMLTQWQNLALSAREVYREKKGMHFLDPKMPHGWHDVFGQRQSQEQPPAPLEPSPRCAGMALGGGSWQGIILGGGFSALV